MKFVATKRYDKKIFSSLSFVAVFGSWIRDPGSKVWDPGWVKIRIWDKHPGSATLCHSLRIYVWVLASRLLKSAWVFTLRENLPLLQTLQSSHDQDRMAFVILALRIRYLSFFSVSLS